MANKDSEAVIGCLVLCVVAGLVGWGIYSGVTWWQTSARKAEERKALALLVQESVKRFEQPGGVVPPPVEKKNEAPPVIPDAPTPDPPKVETYVFWPDDVLRASQDYLMTANYIPLRAIARRPNVQMYRTGALKFSEVNGLMTPWLPYYVYDRTDTALLLGESSQTPGAQRKWVKEIDCFCWTTRECLSIEKSIPIYATRDDARSQTNPLATGYKYRYIENFRSGEGGAEEQRFRMSALPVLRREEDVLWCFVRPEGTDESGYQVCWIRWDGSAAEITCRVRAARQEFEEYIAGLRKLMVDWKNPELQTSAQQEMYDHALADLTRSERVQKVGIIKSRQEGVPKLTGFLERPIESPLQYQNMSRRVIKMIELSGGDEWDINEVAYIQLEQLP